MVILLEGVDRDIAQAPVVVMEVTMMVATVHPLAVPMVEGARIGLEDMVQGQVMVVDMAVEPMVVEAMVEAVDMVVDMGVVGWVLAITVVLELDMGVALVMEAHLQVVDTGPE